MGLRLVERNHGDMKEGAGPRRHTEEGGDLKMDA